MGKDGEWLFKDRQHLRKSVDTDERTTSNCGNTANVSREIDNFSHNFIRPIEAQVIGGFAQNDIGHGGEKSYTDCSEK